MQQEKREYKLTLNIYDRDFFRREILEFRDTDYTKLTPSRASHRLIRRARDYFENKFKEEYQKIGNQVEAYKWALRVQKVLTDHFSVVSVVSDDEDNAATVFETLNDRGIGLSTPDLLRNFLLRKASDDVSREQMVELWKNILSIEDDTKLRGFIRHYWISKEGDVKTQGLYREIKDVFLKRGYKSLDFTRNLSDAASIYKDILAAQHEDIEIAKMLRNINELGASLLYPTILSLSQTKELDDIKIMMKAMIVYFVRHNVICHLENSIIEKHMFETAKQLRQSLSVQQAIEGFKLSAPDDATFVKSFKTAKISRAETAKYLLREIEEVTRTGEVVVALPSVVHLEHIYPQNPPLSQTHRNHAEIINRIGNLTLLLYRLNASIGNSDFNEKKETYKQSEINMTRELIEIDIWNEETISRRQEQLGEKALKIWSFD